MFHSLKDTAGILGEPNIDSLAQYEHQVWVLYIVGLSIRHVYSKRSERAGSQEFDQFFWSHDYTSARLPSLSQQARLQ